MENSNRNDMNNSEDTRRDYESPATNLTRVKMEGYLCGSANITNPNEEQGRINAHETNEDFSIDNGTSSDWQTDVWTEGN